MCAVQATRGTSLIRQQATDREAASLRWGRWLLVAVALGGYFLDRATKIWAVRTLDPSDPPSYLGGFLKLRLIFNPGAAFSLGSNITIVFGLLAIGVLVGLLVWVVPRVRGWWPNLACGLLLAGISGNLTDRLTRPPGVLRGEVIDFIALPHFAIFNVADICITAAAVIIAGQMIFGSDPDSSEGDEPAGTAAAVDPALICADPDQPAGRDARGLV